LLASVKLDKSEPELIQEESKDEPVVVEEKPEVVVEKKSVPQPQAPTTNALPSNFEENMDRFNTMDDGQLESQVNYMKSNKHLMKMNYK